MQLIPLPSILQVIMVYILEQILRRAMQATGTGSPEANAFVRLQYPVQNSDVLVDLGGETMHHLQRLWRNDEGQDIAEYAVMLAVILVIVVGTVRLIGSSANNVFSNVASSIQ
jgi:Flp pilus assembly pilin Flp